MAEELCSILEEASGNIFYNVIISAKMIVCLGGAAFLLRQWMKHGSRFLVHANSRVLFNFYYTMFFVLGFNMGILYLIDFIRGFCIASILSAHLILILMSLERLYSSFFPDKFEKSSAQLRTAIVAGIVVAVATFYVTWNLTNGFLLFHAHYVPMADPKVTENGKRYVETMVALSISNGCSLAIFFLDIYLNFYRKIRKNLSLGASYQFSENRRVILVLMPIEIVDSILTLLTTIAQILHAKYAPDVSLLDRQIFLESTTFIVAYPLILAIIIALKVGRRKRPVLPCERSIDYFENLQKIWA